MRLLLEKARSWIGTRLVRFGLKVSGFQLDEEDEIDEEDCPFDPSQPTVELNDKARAMVAEGAEPEAREPKQEERPLNGSSAARFNHARAKLIENQRPRG